MIYSNAVCNVLIIYWNNLLEVIQLYQIIIWSHIFWSVSYRSSYLIIHLSLFIYVSSWENSLVHIRSTAFLFVLYYILNIYLRAIYITFKIQLKTRMTIMSYTKDDSINVVYLNLNWILRWYIVKIIDFLREIIKNICWYLCKLLKYKKLLN